VIEGDLTPLMRQYRQIKQAHQGAILFFRVGDFYEMFYEDAEEASRLLSIALTSRDKNRPDPVPLCGIPYHAAMGYVAKLLKAGRTVAICDQVEDPKLAKGLVRREVVRLYTPGTLIDPELLSPREPNYLAAVVPAPGSAKAGAARWGLAVLDHSTGQFCVQEFNDPSGTARLQDELARLEPREILYPHSAEPGPDAVCSLLRRPMVTGQDASWFAAKAAERVLQEHFGVASLDGFGCKGLTLGVQAAGAVLRYVRQTQPAAQLTHVHRLLVRHDDDAMHLDAATMRNLELLRSTNDDTPSATLLSVLDCTVSPMGSRLLRQWVARPLTRKHDIQARLEAVAVLAEHLQHRDAIRRALSRVQDIPRLNARIAVGAVTPRDLLALRDSSAALPGLRGRLQALSSSVLLAELERSWDDLQDVHHLIERMIRPDAPQALGGGGIVKDGYNARLDELRTICRTGKEQIAGLERAERERTGIDSLKVRYNQVFGYYIEITKANLTRVPPSYTRKQTLTNAERFTTHELKELEESILGAESQLHTFEQELFDELRLQLAKETSRLEHMGSALGELDALAALAETAAAYQYVRPHIDDGDTIQISAGRHPVIERMELQGGFIPNDTLLDRGENRLLIITGPNMAGKSTYLRQVALIVLMAQMGSFVPAEAARIGIVDRVFTRVGASDNLARGQSTFLVEMSEAAQILSCATARSLILLDEIGRGTSTYDGLSIAWAITEYIQDASCLGARTLFATHYHEMTELARLREGIRNYTVAVRERDDEVLFLRKIVPGGADRSYGIHVAKLAGLPPAVIDRARQVLAQLESASSDPSSASTADQRLSADPLLPPPHPIIDEVRQMDLFSMTPLEALNRLAELQRRLETDPPQP
jgi:DNA mismatch repair protein MutS